MLRVRSVNVSTLRSSDSLLCSVPFSNRVQLDVSFSRFCRRQSTFPEKTAEQIGKLQQVQKQNKRLNFREPMLGGWMTKTVLGHHAATGEYVDDSKVETSGNNYELTDESWPASTSTQAMAVSAKELTDISQLHLDPSQSKPMADANTGNQGDDSNTTDAKGIDSELLLQGVPEAERPGVLWRHIASRLTETDPDEACKFLSTTYPPPGNDEAAALNVMKDLVSHYFGQDLSRLSLSLSPFYETVLDLVPRSKMVWKLFVGFPKDSFLEKCPAHLNSRLRDLYKAHWEACEAHLQSAMVLAHETDFEQAIAELRFAVEAGGGNPVHETQEFRNSFLAILAPNHPYTDLDSVSPAIVTGLLHLAIQLPHHLYVRLIEFSLESKSLAPMFHIWNYMRLNLDEIDDRLLIRLFRGMKRCDDPGWIQGFIEAAVAQVQRHGNKYVATDILHCVMLFHLRRGDTALFTIIQPYLRHFDVRPLVDLGMPVRKFRKSRQIRLDNISMGMIFYAYFREHRGNVAIVENTYRRFQEAVLKRQRPILLCLRKTPSVYNMFMLAFAYLPGAYIGYCMNILTDLNRGIPKHELPYHPPQTRNRIEFGSPNMWSWNIFLGALNRHRHLAAAEKVIDRLRELGRMNDIAYNNLINSYAIVQDPAAVADALRRMSADGFQVTDYTIRAVERLEDKDALARFLEEDQDRSILADITVENEERDEEEKEEEEENPESRD